jgi:hypothetical protein
MPLSSEEVEREIDLLSNLESQLAGDIRDLVSLGPGSTEIGIITLWLLFVGCDVPHTLYPSTFQAGLNTFPDF